MTTKSIVLTAVAAAGMVANAEVWDIKFSLKTVDNNKKTSVKIVGAYLWKRWVMCWAHKPLSHPLRTRAQWSNSP